MSKERNEYHKDWRDKKAKEDPFYSHKKALKELYKTTKEWYDNKLAEQGGTCALCPSLRQASRSEKRLSVDHNHAHCPGKRACGKCNRGLLCFNCNKRLGHLEALRKEAITIIPERGTWLERAVEYIQKYEEIKLREFVAQFPTWEAHPMWGNIRVPWPPPPADGARIVEIGAPALFGIELPEGATITGLRWDADLRVSGPYQGLKRSEYPGKLWSPFQDTVKITGADKPVEEI